MRYYRLEFEIVDGRALANISFAVTKNKIDPNASRELMYIGGSLQYGSLNNNYKDATFNKIKADIFNGAFAIQEFYELKNQIQYLDKKLEKEARNIKKLLDVIDYLKNSKKYKRIVYDNREQDFIVVDNLKPEDYKRYGGYTENDEFVISIVSNKSFSEVEKTLKENAKKKLENSAGIGKKLLKQFIENGYVQRDIRSEKPEVKNIW
jgi:hypothetical protein